MFPMAFLAECMAPLIFMLNETSRIFRSVTDGAVTQILLMLLMRKDGYRLTTECHHICSLERGNQCNAENAACQNFHHAISPCAKNDVHESKANAKRITGQSGVRRIMPDEPLLAGYPECCFRNPINIIRNNPSIGVGRQMPQ